MSIASTIQRRVVLRQATEDDYLLLGTAKDVLTQNSPPGRGVVDGNEIQVAVLGGSSNLAVQSRELGRLAESMARHGVSAAVPIGRLGTTIALSGLPVPSGDRIVVGVDDETLAPAVVDARGALLVSGPPGSGRTTALATIAASARRLPVRRQLVLFAPRRSTIAATGLFDTSFTTADDAARGARQLADAITAGSVPPGSLVVVVEMLAEFSGTSAEAELDRLVREALRADHFVVGESESSTWGQAYLLGAPFRAGRRGLLLVPGDMEGDTLLGTPLGRFRRSDLPPGRGYLVMAGRARRLQVAQPGGGWGELCPSTLWWWVRSFAVMGFCREWSRQFYEKEN
jgi:S-DNA-T family DNA segregation ATPase FtsK/SpoIIIE